MAEGHTHYVKQRSKEGPSWNHFRSVPVCISSWKQLLDAVEDFETKKNDRSEDVIAGMVLQMTEYPNNLCQAD